MKSKQKYQLYVNIYVKRQLIKEREKKPNRSYPTVRGELPLFVFPETRPALGLCHKN